MKLFIIIILVTVLAITLVGCGGNDTDVGTEIANAESFEEAARIAVEEKRSGEFSPVRNIHYNPAAEILNIELTDSGKSVFGMHDEARFILSRLKARTPPELIIISYWFPAAGGGELQGMRIEFNSRDFNRTDFQNLRTDDIPRRATDYFIHADLS